MRQKPCQLDIFMPRCFTCCLLVKSCTKAGLAVPGPLIPESVATIFARQPQIG